MLGFKSFENARIVLAGIELITISTCRICNRVGPMQKWACQELYLASSRTNPFRLISSHAREVCSGHLYPHWIYSSCE